MSSTSLSSDSPSDHTNSDHESDCSSEHTGSPLAQGGNLWKEEIKILEADIDQWKSANKNKRTTVVTCIRSKIKNLEANKTLKTHEWVRKKKDINLVFEKASIKQGSAQMIKGYQKAVDKVMKTLTEEEKAEAEELAKEWNKQHPPLDVQANHDFNDELGDGSLWPIIMLMLVTHTKKVVSHRSHHNRHRTRPSTCNWQVQQCQPVGPMVYWSTKALATSMSMNAKQPYTPVPQRTSCNKTPFPSSILQPRRVDDQPALTNPKPLPITHHSAAEHTSEDGISKVSAATRSISSGHSRSVIAKHYDARHGPAPPLQHCSSWNICIQGKHT
ncbi:hypothetical protein J3A83DRAFT_4185673 [Scleroderma citrinum]